MFPLQFQTFERSQPVFSGIFALVLVSRLNEIGEVIGMISMRALFGEGIGFAIPVDSIRSALPSLISKKKVPRPYIGVKMKSDLVSELFDQYHFFLFVSVLFVPQLFRSFGNQSHFHCRSFAAGILGARCIC